MSTPLGSYLHDHLAGAAAAIDLLQDLRQDHEGQPLARFATVLLDEISADRDTLRRIAQRVDTPESPIKDAIAWISEKASRLKLERGDRLGTFEAIETLSLGILGKRALWHALATIADRDPRLDGFDFDELARRAEDQFARVDRQRLAMTDVLLERQH